MLLFLGWAVLGCDSADENAPAVRCEVPSEYVFQEADSILSIEFEYGSFEESSKWKVVESDKASGGKYVVWQGDNFLNKPGNGIVTFRLNVQHAGTYRFTWKSTVTVGDNGTEHNDSWLRFSDADDFYAEKGGKNIYPGGTGKTPNPNGSSKEGWFKVYRSGNDLGLKWQARTSDNDAHDIYVRFDSPGMYQMEVSGRSYGHGIDQFILLQEDRYAEDDATALTDFSEITCN